jgi:hypothetical protein
VDYEAVVRIVDAEAIRREEIETRAVAGVTRAYDGLDWYDHAEITVAATRAGQVVRASSQVSVALADAAMTRILAQVVGGSPRPAGTMTITQPLRQGVSGWAGVYGRVADTVRLQVANGLPLEEAVGMGLQRADAMCRTDLGLARREQWRRSLTANPEVIGFRRAIHPEASKTGVCGLCIAAADRVYNRGELLPLHSHCVCTVLPITQVHDPGGTLNDADLKAVYESADSNRRDDLKRVRYQVQEHGELGPVLTDSRQHFRGPDEVAAARRRRSTRTVTDIDATRTVAQLQATLTELERSALVFESAGTRARLEELRTKIAARP